MQAKVRTGDNNTLLGYNANVNSGVSNGTAIGVNARVTQRYSLVLGSINRVNGATADTNVGLGTTAPAAKLDVVGSIALNGKASNGNILQLRGGADLNHGLLYSSTTDGPEFRAFGGFRWTNGTTGATERMRLTSFGSLGIGTTNPQDRLHIVGDIRVGTGTDGCVRDADATVIAGTCSSDARLKRDVRPFPHLLDKFIQLQPVTFYWRAEEFKERHFGNKPSYGLIAQEVEKVLPELVVEDEQGYKAVNYSKLPLLSIQAIKELKQVNGSLKQKLSE